MGLTVTTQAAFINPTTRNFQLTRGGDAMILVQPVPLAGLTQWSYRNDTTSPTGGSLNQSLLPILRLTY